MLQLADEYRRAADVLAPTGRTREPLSRSPYRLLAIQAIELYLNSYLLDQGHDALSVRRLQHDLAARARLAEAAGLRLRVKTSAHLRALCAGREYLVSRYAPERSDGSQLNRLAATMNEVAAKARQRPPSPRSVPRSPSSPRAAQPG